MDIKKTFVYFLFFGIIFSFFYGFLYGENSAGAGGYNGDLSWIIKNIEIFKNHSIIDAIKHPDIYGNRPPLIYILNKLFNPFCDASQTPFSVINPVTYLAGVTSNAKFIALLFFG